MGVPFRTAPYPESIFQQEDHARCSLYEAKRGAETGGYGRFGVQYKGSGTGDNGCHHAESADPLQGKRRLPVEHAEYPFSHLHLCLLSVNKHGLEVMFLFKIAAKGRGNYAKGGHELGKVYHGKGLGFQSCPAFKN